MRNFLQNLILGIFAGMLIGIGGASNLQLSSMGYPVLGGVFFSFGLMCVCLLGAKLFTGKVGYALENRPSYLLDVLYMAIGNVIGALIVGYLCGLIFPSWNYALEPKLLYGEGASWYLCFFRAMGAGVFVYLAVECFRKIENVFAKLFMVMLSIATMVILGCNHSIANVFYFAYGQVRFQGFDGLNATLSVLVAMVGNSLGSIIVYLLQRGFVIALKPKGDA